MMKKVNFLIVLLCWLSAPSLHAQRDIAETPGVRIEWKSPLIISVPGSPVKIEFLDFEGASYPRDFSSQPFLSVQKENTGSESFKASLEVIEVIALSPEESKIVSAYKVQPAELFVSDVVHGKSRNQLLSYLHIFPIRINKNTGQYEKLLRYKINWTSGTFKSSSSSSTIFASSSVLANGTWYKMGIANTGIYKIDKTFLAKLGIDVSTITPSDIRIFGNGGKILPEKNDTFRYDDLNEIAISVIGEGDGVFNDNDYILFYGKGPKEWDYTPSSNKLKFSYVKNYYTDSSFYFITVDNGPGKRIQSQSSSSIPYSYTSTTFDDYDVHDFDGINLVKSGREMYGEYFDIATSYSFTFNFPNLVVNDSAMIRAAIGGRSFSAPADFRVSHPSGNFIVSCPVTGSTYLDDVAKDGVGISKFINSGSTMTISVDKLTSSATGWLNSIIVNVRRDLTMNGPQMLFRDTRAISASSTSRFIITSAALVKVWDVTDPFNVADQQVNQNGTSWEFVVPSPQLKQFVAYTGTSFYTPAPIGKIPNQNLHATQPVDYIIVCHPLFRAHAQRLADLHAQFDSLSYVVATIDEIYNEFSSGAQDITAIRDFVRMIYKRATPSALPKYLLLFGDGSYDNKNRYLSSNTNYVPTYESYSSASYLGSFASDDFFGFLDDTEGDFQNNDIVDIGVGRLPAQDVTEAENLVNKIAHYYKREQFFDPNATSSVCATANKSTFGDWRNWICFVADDANEVWEKTFVMGSEVYAGQVSATNKNFNIDKIYLDAYKQESTPGGERYPDAIDALNKRIDKGALIINYSGHGGETGLAHEGVVDIPQIMKWDNLNNLPMFLTATCEFSRYDDPARTSAGEEILLNPIGGGIALFTTTRVAFASDGDNICPKFFAAALVPLGNKMPLLGDIVRLTKIGVGAQLRHFTLLGDPAVKMAYPKDNITTTAVNSTPAGTNDTISALEKVTVTGFVCDKTGAKITTYNGAVYPTVFDKSVKYSTLGNDLGPAGVMNFYLQKNILYKGKALVTNGDFSFTFIVPKDILYQYGLGRISYYAQNGQSDATGNYEQIVIGGSDPNAAVDVNGPEVKLFMNDSRFVYGGTTNEDPSLYAEVFDSSGINTVGNGIGHDLVAVLDANSSQPIVLNEYYQSDLNSFQSGKVIYPFNELTEGTHSLSIKVWDVQNNSASAFTEFVVSPSAELALKHVLNYPNPFTTKTAFYVEHNQCCVNMNIEIQVFTVSGKIVKTLNRNVTNQGYRLDGIEWDGKDDYGDKIGQGVYVYRVKVKTADGKSSEKFEKLVILN